MIMNLKQAKEQGKLDQFIDDHKSIKGDGIKLEKLINSACKTSSKAQETSRQDSSENCNDTQTP